MTRVLLYIYSSMDMCQETVYTWPLLYLILDCIKMAMLNKKARAGHTETRIVLVTVRYTYVGFFGISIVTSILLYSL